jgi:hypothetical protein
LAQRLVDTPHEIAVVDVGYIDPDGRPGGPEVVSQSLSELGVLATVAHEDADYVRHAASSVARQADYVDQDTPGEEEMQAHVAQEVA